MPYMKKGKCVYKKKQDGSQGKKVGCTEGSVDDYLKALYANADGETKKENKTMKIKKSALLELIKEEIMDEMRGVTMMPDPNDDDAVPAGMEPGGAMQQVGKEIDRLVTMEMDDQISMISNYLVTAGIGSDPVKLAYKGMGMLRDAGLTPPDMAALEKMTAAQDYDDDDDYDDDYDFSEFEADMMMENITDPAVQQTLLDVAAKLAPLVAGLGLPALMKAVYDELRDPRNKKKRGEM